MSETMELGFIQQRQVQLSTLFQKLFLIDFIHPSQKFFQALGWIDQGGISAIIVALPGRERSIWTRYILYVDYAPTVNKFASLYFPYLARTVLILLRFEQK